MPLFPFSFFLSLFLIHNVSPYTLLGNGAFGTVRLCREKSTGKLFCVKILDRNKIRFLKQREHIINERTIMFSVNHPFMVKLYVNCNQGVVWWY